MKKILLRNVMFAALVCTSALKAQPYAYRSALPPVTAEGYYHIALPPFVRNQMQPSMHDIRLYNSKREQVPYLLKPATTDKHMPPTYATFKADTMRVGEKGKHTIVDLRFSDKRYIMYVAVCVSHDAKYYRDVAITYGNGITKNTILKSGDANMFSIGEVFDSAITVNIDNKDDKPLHIDSVVCFQTGYALLAKLHPDEHYNLVFGNSKADKPEYDLGYFADSLPAVKGLIYPYSAVPLKIHEKVSETEQQKHNPWLLWASLAIVCLLLLLMSAKVLKDLRTRNKA